jgi:hypothetical protein
VRLLQAVAATNLKQFIRRAPVQGRSCGVGSGKMIVPGNRLSALIIALAEARYHEPGTDSKSERRNGNHNNSNRSTGQLELSVPKRKGDRGTLENHLFECSRAKKATTCTSGGHAKEDDRAENLDYSHALDPPQKPWLTICHDCSRNVIRLSRLAPLRP